MNIAEYPKPARRVYRSHSPNSSKGRIWGTRVASGMLGVKTIVHMSSLLFGGTMIPNIE